MSNFLNYREESRKNYGTSQKDSLTLEQLSVGANLRIADALEIIAKDKKRLEDDYNYMRENRDYWRQQFEIIQNKYRGQKGLVTKLKKKLNGTT